MADTEAKPGLAAKLKAHPWLVGAGVGGLGLLALLFMRRPAPAGGQMAAGPAPDPGAGSGGSTGGDSGGGGTALEGIAQGLQQLADGQQQLADLTSQSMAAQTTAITHVLGQQQQKLDQQTQALSDFVGAGGLGAASTAGAVHFTKPSVGPALGWGTDGQQPSFTWQENLAHVESDTAYRQQELARTVAVLKNREAAGLDTTKQEAWLNTLLILNGQAH